MGFTGNLVSFLIIIFSIILYLKIKPMFDPPPIPHVEEVWWGPDEPWKADTSIKPFKINVSDEMFQDLKNRLDNHIPFQPPLEGVKHNYGMNTNLLNEIVDYWRTKYNWREREKFLNKYPQFKVNIHGLNIHFLHVKPKVKKGIKVLPMLLLHGWPGSVREFYEMIPILTTPHKKTGIAFEVIIPSFPGFGFSDAARRPGFTIAHMANIFKTLMDKLGFEKYYVQGGNWGAVIVQLIATMYPNKVIGLHGNGCNVNTPLQFIKTLIGSYSPWLIGISKEHEEYFYPISAQTSFFLLEAGYLHIQATKPDTVGVALRDSPVGLAAYILEKFITWTNGAYRNLDDGGLKKAYSYEKLLDNVMIYWITRSMTTSMRIYAETINKDAMDLASDRSLIEVPSGCARFKRDFTAQPDVILKEKFVNLIHSSHYDGGLFAAFEMPQVLAEDIFQFVEKVENLKTDL